jgi:hypothetical protein
MEFEFRTIICTEGVQMPMYINRIRKLTICKSLLVFVFFLFYGSFLADAADNHYTTRPNAVFCKSLTAMHTLQISLSLRDGKAVSMLNGKDCEVVETGVVVYIVREEKDIVRVQLASSGKYFWVSRKALR